MLNPNAMKDIRFPREKTNILLRGGILMRDEIVGSEPMITMKNVAFGKARRILNYSYMEVLHNDVWVMVKSFEEDLLKALYMESSTVTNDGKRIEEITCPNIEAMTELLKEVATGPVEVVPSLIGEFPVVTVNADVATTATAETTTTSAEVPFTFTSTEEDNLNDYQSANIIKTSDGITTDNDSINEIMNLHKELDKLKVMEGLAKETQVEEESEENATEEEVEDNTEAPAEEEKKEEPTPVNDSANTFAATAARQPVHNKKKHRH